MIRKWIDGAGRCMAAGTFSLACHYPMAYGEAETDLYQIAKGLIKIKKQL